jgi:hypothetical protein
MQRLIAFGVLIAAALFLRSGAGRAQEGEDEKKIKEALQELNDYIGGWKGNGTTEANTLDIWKEHADWSWRFKGKDAWLTLKLTPGKHFTGGEVRYLSDREVYQMTMFARDGKKQVFEGPLKRGGKLLLERRDPDTEATQQLQLNLAGGGIRFVYTLSVKPANRTLFTREFQVSFTKEGETFGAAQKKVECPVTGGLGTIPVSFNGVTYYVCCSGCRDAFNENPAKYVREYNARKKGN